MMTRRSLIARATALLAMQQLRVSACAERAVIARISKA